MGRLNTVGLSDSLKKAGYSYEYEYIESPGGLGELTNALDINLRVFFPDYTIVVTEKGQLFISRDSEEVLLGDEFWGFLEILNKFR